MNFWAALFITVVMIGLIAGLVGVLIHRVFDLIDAIADLTEVKEMKSK